MRKWIVGLGLAAAAALVSTAASAHGGSWSVTVGGYGPPVYGGYSGGYSGGYYPGPYYGGGHGYGYGYARPVPPPVYMAPPVYIRPPVYVAPPMYYGPPRGHFPHHHRGHRGGRVYGY